MPTDVKQVTRRAGNSRREAADVPACPAAQAEGGSAFPAAVQEQVDDGGRPDEQDHAAPDEFCLRVGKGSQPDIAEDQKEQDGIDHQTGEASRQQEGEVPVLRLGQDEDDQADLEEDGQEGICFLGDAHGFIAEVAALSGQGRKKLS